MVEDTTEQRERAEFDAFIDALNASEAAEMTPAEVAAGDNAPGVQGGGTEIRVTVPGTPETLVRDDPDDPRDAPPPTIYGEEIDLCPVGNVRGQFEPSQGVWQDDPTFADKPGKQIVRVSPVLWRAELPMVTGRKTLLHGIERAEGAEPRRNEIFVKGEATGQTLIPVRFRFTLKQLGGERILYEGDEYLEIPIGEPCREDAVLPFEYSIDATDGVPRDVDFTIDAAGDYLMEAELVTWDGRQTGIKVTVLGRVVTTRAPKVAFRVVTILSSAREASQTMDQAAIDLSTQTSSYIPDFFPIVNRRLEKRTFRPLDRGDLLNVLARQPRLSELGAESGDGYFAEGIREELMRQLEVGGLMSGYDRIVVLVADGDFRLLWSGSVAVEPKFDAGGFANSQKVVFVNLQTSASPFLVAHEIIHTIPYPFAEAGMVAECGLNYHNTFANIAHGHRVTTRLQPRRRRMDGSPAVMSAAGPWITQCSYRHLLEVLAQGVPDPPVLLVQGFVARTPVGSWGLLQPFYDLLGVEDLASGGEGGWSIVLRNARGNVLARHSWEPHWDVADLEVERSLVAFVFRLHRPEGLATVELEGPDGVLDARPLSATPPEVTIVSPDEQAVVDDEVLLEWIASDPDGDPVLSTVLYSPDGGETWMDVAFETTGTSARVPLDPEAPIDAHRVLVRVTDGGRSADAVRILQTASGGP